MGSRWSTGRHLAFLMTLFVALALVVPSTRLVAVAEEVAEPVQELIVEGEDVTSDTPADDGSDGQGEQSGPSDVDPGYPVVTSESLREGLTRQLTAVGAPTEVLSEQRTLAVPQADGFTDYGGLSIAGGTPGVSYDLESVAYTRIGRGNNEVTKQQNGRLIVINGSRTDTLSMLEIKQSGTYIIRNTNGTGTGVSIGIRVAPGVKADITFAGVNINTTLPFEIVTNSTQSGNLTAEVEGSEVANPTTVHITLADGSVNTLKQTSYAEGIHNDSGPNQFPGIRCGEGSVLTIDDSVRNVDTAGNHITPVDGAIPAGTTYVAKDGSVVTSTGKGADQVTSLSNLESSNPGSLSVYSGGRSAAIGGGPMENSGLMTFDGGTILARSAGYGITDGSGTGSGCGIGGGHAAGSTLTTFNGGSVDAWGGFHSAGIGGGCTYIGGMSSSTVTYPFRDALISRAADTTLAGDITINGGFIKAHGCWHSNAFGQGCGGNNTGKTILVTGGTLLPSSSANEAFLDIGGNGGYVIITGGSVFCNKKTNGQYKFQGNKNDGKAWGDLAMTKPVSLVSVDVTPKIQAMAQAEGVTPDLNAKLESWEMLIDKFPTDPVYGAPSRLDNGKLYLWLPEGTNLTHQIDANFSYYVGDKLLTSKTTLPTGNTGTTVKEWEDFELPEEFVEQNWSKYYDGTPLPTIDLTQTPIPVENPAGGQLSDNSKIKYNYQQVSETGSAWGTAITGSTTPSDAGLYDIEVRSEQYANNAAFTQTYWGHNATGTATISPVTSKTLISEMTQGVEVTFTSTDKDGNTTTEKRTYTEPTWVQDNNANFNTATNNHLVVPVDIASDLLPFGDAYADGSTMSRTTCAAPTGTIQLMIDGRAVPASLGGTIQVGRSADGTGLVGAQLVRDGSGRAHTVACFNLTRAQLDAFRLDNTADGTHHVSVSYTSARANAIPRDTVASQALEDEGTQAADRQAGVGTVEPAYSDSSYVNYYESTSAEVQVQIETVDPDFDLFNEQGTGYVPNGEGLEGEALTANTAKLNLTDAHRCGWMDDAGALQGTRYDCDAVDFRDEVDENGIVTKANQDWFPLYVRTNSIGDLHIESSNPAVIAIIDNDLLTDRDFDSHDGAGYYGVGAKARVMSAGKTTITATVAGTGAYAGASRSFDVYVYPDLAKKPQLEVVETARNLDRTDGTVRPGDNLLYTVEMTNTVPDSACLNPIAKVKVPADGTVVSVTLVAADGTRTEVENPTLKDGVLIVDGLPTIYGEQTVAVEVRVKVDDDIFDEGHGTPDLSSEVTGEGIYGVDPDAFEWDDRIDTETGEPVDETGATAVPTTRPEDEVADILGGTLVVPGENDPDDPAGDERPAGVVVAGVDPGPEGGPVPPLASAVKADPDDPDQPAPAVSDPEHPEDGPVVPREPILPGDRIVRFGEEEPPRTPEDIAREVERAIDEARQNDPDATSVDIPVTVEREVPDPDDPSAPPTVETIHVIVTIPLTPEGLATERELTPQPNDVDPRDGGDITVTKTAKNVTKGISERADRTVALVGDTIRYTVTVSNSKQGGAWYDVIVKDELPRGLSYRSGSAQVTLSDGTELEDFESDFNASSRIISFCLGDLVSVSEAMVTFDCTVTPQALGAAAPTNSAIAFGTQPSSVPAPGGDDEPPREPVAPGPWDPEDHGTTWEEVEEQEEDEIRETLGLPEDEQIERPEGGPARIDGKVTEISPADPDHSLLTVSKDSELIHKAEGEREEGTVLVGDVIRYTITLTNGDEAHTRWNDVAVYDRLPAGLEVVSGSIHLTLGDGTDIACPDDAYDPLSGDLSVHVGDVNGGETIQVSFEALVGKGATGGDITNVAKIAGTDPSATAPREKDGSDRPDPGSRRNPEGVEGILPPLDLEGGLDSPGSFPGDILPVVVDPAGDEEPPADDPIPSLPGGGADIPGPGTGSDAQPSGDDAMGAVPLPDTGAVDGADAIVTIKPTVGQWLSHILPRTGDPLVDFVPCLAASAGATLLALRLGLGTRRRED